MTMTEIKKIAKNYCILDCEIEDAICFVRDLLEYCVDDLKDKEPYATVTIRSMWEAAKEVDNLLWHIDEIEEN